MRRLLVLLAVLAAACGAPRAADTAPPPAASEEGAASAPTDDELPCLPIVSGCGCSYSCAQAIRRNDDGSFEVSHDLQDSRLDRATIVRLCLPDGRCREAFEDGTPCGGECIPTDAHFGCRRDGNRCVP
jgi:hypothetical protein